MFTHMFPHMSTSLSLSLSLSLHIYTHVCTCLYAQEQRKEREREAAAEKERQQKRIEFEMAQKAVQAAKLRLISGLGIVGRGDRKSLVCVAWHCPSSKPN